MDDPNLDAAATKAWYSIPEKCRNLMVHCYNIRSLGSRKSHNQEHPTPSIRFALGYFADPSIPMSPPLRTLASELLLYATIKPHPDRMIFPDYAFDDTEGEFERKEEEEERDIQWGLILNDGEPGVWC